MPIRRIQHQSCGEHLLERGLVTIEGTLSIQTLQIDKARQGSTRLDKDRQGSTRIDKALQFVEELLYRTE
jgi:hypothetical protein